jgi:hypothetical protein
MTTARAAEQRRAPAVVGWPLVGWSASAVAALCSATFLAAGGDEAGLRAAIRLSAKTSLALFTSAFIASSVRALWPSALTTWLLANRRYLGVSFAASHAMHLLAIVALARVASDFRLDPATLIGGGFAYVLLAAMTATSFDRSAAWIGPRRWHLLHTTGMYYCWFIFFISYLPRALVESVLYLPFVVVLVGALVLRIIARRAAASAR